MDGLAWFWGRISIRFVVVHSRVLHSGFGICIGFLAFMEGICHDQYLRPLKCDLFFVGLGITEFGASVRDL